MPVKGFLLTGKAGYKDDAQIVKAHQLRRCAFWGGRKGKQRLLSFQEIVALYRII